MHDFIVGVDAGASHTVAALARGERVLRTAVGDPANPNVGGLGPAVDAVARTIERLLGNESAAAIGVGAAGAGDDAMRSALAAALASRFPHARLTVGDDAHIALRAAIPSGDGIVVIAGTGSIAYAEVGGSSRRAGGYGYLLGDEGSGYAIGAAALRRLLQIAQVHAPQDPMLADLALQIGSNGLREAIARIYASRTPAAEIAACAPLVLRYAAAGEPGAREIVEKAAADLAELVSVILDSDQTASLPLAFAGGLLRESNALSQLLEVRIANDFPHLGIVKGGAPAYLGALADARRILQAP